jgi:energy-converting hydrogenase Eha subunit C
MVATDWSDKDAMGELAIAGHVCAVLQLLGILAHLHVLQAFCDSIVTVLLFVYCTHYILRIENLNQNNQYYQILSLF